MISRRHFSKLAIAATTLPAACAPSNEPKLLEWTDLVPEHIAKQRAFDELTAAPVIHDFTALLRPEDTRSDAEIAEEIKATLVHDLEDTHVKMPGYALPISLDGAATTEFLLVPYVGACIHVPPPPANQVVFVRLQSPYEFAGLFDPIWVTGTMFTTAMMSDLAEIGYRIDADKIEAYDIS